MIQVKTVNSIPSILMALNCNIAVRLQCTTAKTNSQYGQKMSLFCECEHKFHIHYGSLQFSFKSGMKMADAYNNCA